MTRNRAADMLAGLIAAAVALGAAELAAGLTGGTSLMVEVGDAIIEFAPGSVATAAIGGLGTSAKPTLLAGVLAGTLVVGAALGPPAGRWKPFGPIAFAIVGLAGAAAAAHDPMTSMESAVFSAVLAAAAGSVALRGLLDAATPVGPPRPQMPGQGVVDRRGFLTFAAGVTGAAAFATLVGRSFGPAVDVDAQRALVTLPPTEVGPGSSEFAINGLSPLITPNEEFYRIDTALVVPRVEASDWTLSITGMVDRPFELTLEELIEMATLEAVVTLACVSNEVGGDLVGNAAWQGVALTDLLDRAGVQAGATQIVGRSVDNFTVGIPTDLALDGRPAMVAVGMNGVALPADHGFPARLVVPGFYGYVSATKWLKEIELNTLEGYDAYWIPRGYAKDGPIKTQSRIDTPRHGRTIDPGPRAIAGVAWGGIRSIERVEVRVTSRASGAAAGEWVDAQVGPALSQNSWRQWVFAWDATPGEYQIEVRATDGEGITQTDVRQAPKPDGATGHHRIGLAVRDSSTVADPNTLSHPQAALDAARALWVTEGGTSYDMNFNWRCVCTAEHVQPVDLEIRDRALTAGAAAADGAALNADRLAEYRTVEGLFDLIQAAIDDGAAAIDVTYAARGYPAEAEIDYALRLSDDERGFVISSLDTR